MTALRRPDDVAVVDDGDRLYLAPVPDGPITVLDGVAALIWVEACAGDRGSIADRVAGSTDATADAIRDDVDAFVSELVARGLLE